MIERLHALAPSAKRKLALVMKSHSRESLKKLYEFLVHWKGGANPDKSQLFSATFGTAYSASKDYLIRNEIRLLGAEIDEVLVTEEFLKTYKANPSFRALWEYQAGIDVPSNPDPLPKSPSPKDFAYDQPAHLGDLLEVSLKRALGTNEIHSTTAEEMILASERLIHLRQTEAARKLAQASLIHGTAVRWARQGPTQLHLEQANLHFDLGRVKNQDPVASFLFSQLRSQCLSGHDKIQALQAGLEHLSQCEDTKLFDKSGKEMGFLAMIALEWYLLGDYGQANHCYEDAIGRAAQKKHPMLMAIVSNFMSSLLKSENYVRAIEVVEQYHAYFIDNQQAHFFLESLKAMSYIFLAKPSAALATIPHDIQQRRGGTYLTFRFVQVIAFYLQHDAEAAEREAMNIAKMIRYWKKNDPDRMKELEIDYLVIAGWLAQFFQSALQLPADRNAKWAKLRAGIEAHPLMETPLFRDYLPLKWLLQQKLS